MAKKQKIFSGDFDLVLEDGIEEDPDLLTEALEIHSLWENRQSRKKAKLAEEFSEEF